MRLLKHCGGTEIIQAPANLANLPFELLCPTPRKSQASAGLYLDPVPF